MRVTFRVQRAYKGDLGTEVRVYTGWGGGDCGSVFSAGLTYLVYAWGSGLAQLRVSICSPGGWVDGGAFASELRYLRKERPTKDDLAPLRRGFVEDRSSAEQRRLWTQRYAAATGEICGTVTGAGTKNVDRRTVAFLSLAGGSPIQYPKAEVSKNGSFCSERLGPGQYYLFFTDSNDQGLTAAIYYPGVNSRSQATTFEIGAGQTKSGIVFKISVQHSYSVRGLISTGDKASLGENDVMLRLLRLDDAPMRAWYETEVNFQGSFPLPKVKYFHFDNVLPGDYVVWPTMPGPGWRTRITRVSVTTHSKFVILDLAHGEQD
jgi:hypothetical protein